jgi:hypothetical protein
MLNYARYPVLLIVLAVTPTLSFAEQVRFRFIPVDACGTLAQVPAGPDGALGELRRGLGFTPRPYTCKVCFNQMVTVRHPCTCKCLSVPVRLPEGPPRVEQRSDGVAYNYGDYVVRVVFLPDGGVDVIYNSGLFRPLAF